MFANTLAELPDRDTLLSMSGKDFMLGILNGTLPAPPITQPLNYRLTEVADGRVTFHGIPRFEHTNPMGTVHGGWYGTLLDSAMACAVMTKVPKGSVYTTLEYKINLTRSIPLDREIVCTGTVDHAGRTTGVAHGEIRDVETGQLYATGSTTCVIMKMA